MSIDVYYGNDKVGEIELTEMALDLAEARLSVRHKKNADSAFGITFQYKLNKNGNAKIIQANLSKLEAN